MVSVVLIDFRDQSIEVAYSPVDVRFDITASGSTRNLQVISANPEGVFEQAALNAVERWRYQPNIVDGEPQPFEGLSKRVRFVVDK